MTALPEHPISHQLALFALCGDLVVAIDAMSIREVRPVEDTAVRAASHGVWLIEPERRSREDQDDHGEREALDGEHAGAPVPGWDLGELLGIESAPSAWVIVELPGSGRRVGFRLGRCVTVQSLPVCRAIPRGIFASRRYALAAGFSTAGIPELSEHVSGVVLDLAGVLGDGELGLLANVGEVREAAR
jgi:hypothetical protein